MTSEEVTTWITQERARRQQRVGIARGTREELPAAIHQLWWEVVVAARIPYLVAWLSRRLDK